MHVEEVWNGKSFKARLLRAVLAPASWLYAIGWQTYLAMYRLGLKRAKAPHSPVLCVGNLLVGGTGKTPFTVFLTDTLTDLGMQVAISCSGYGSPRSEAATIPPSGPLKASEWGDEAALIRWLRPDIPLIVGRRRVLAAELCHQSFSDAILVMDDGFQHLPLHKDLTILLDPPQANRMCLPAGPYREPWRNRSRADLVIERFEAPEPRLDEFSIQAKPMSFINPSGELRSIEGEVDVLCALGRPHSFLDSLKSQGLTVRKAELRADHDPLSEGNLLSGFQGDRPIVVTGKDWVKLRERSDVGNYDIAIASYEICVEPHDEFRDWIQARLHGNPPETP